MAVASVSLKELDDVTECAICTEQFADPRVLPCIHTYCLRCLETLTRDKSPADKVPCPLCKKDFTIPDNGIGDLPRNFFIEKLLKIRDITGTQVARKKCETCADLVEGGSQATMFCLDCQQSLCDKCDAFHRRMKISANHRSVKLGDRSESEGIYAKCPPTYCYKHPDKQLELYCVNCKTAICVICYIETHNSHKCSDVAKIAEEFRQLLESDIKSMAGGVDKCREVMQGLETGSKEFVEHISQKQSEINERAEQLKLAIERHRQQLMDQLDVVKKERVGEIEKVCQEVQERASVIQSCKKYAEELLGKGTTGDIARVASDLHQRAGELLKFDAIEQTVQNLGAIDVAYSPTSVSPDDRVNIVGNITARSSTKGVLKFDFPKYNYNQDLPFLSVKDEPQLEPEMSAPKPTLAAEIKSGGEVLALAVLGNRLFITRRGVKHVEVYHRKSSKLQRAISMQAQIQQYGGTGDVLYGLAACAVYNCLYVSSSDSNQVFKYQAATFAFERVFSASQPIGLSINSSNNLLIACNGSNSIMEYNTNAQPVRTITLQGVTDLWHVIQMTDGRYVVSVWDMNHSVCIVNASGQIEKSYQPIKSSDKQDVNLEVPGCIALSSDNHILVADMNGNRVLVIDPTLSRASVLPLPISLDNPFSLVYDEARGSLYVGEWNGGRVLLFDNIGKIADYVQSA